MKPLGIYLHIPFCPYRCNYCDFLIFTSRNKTIPKYVETLIEDLKNFSLDYSDYQIESVFIGGGTPSILQHNHLEKILATLSQFFSLSSPCEISLECNPDTLTFEKLQSYLVAGINRLSLGVQSTQPHHLKRLGRGHSKEQALQSLITARKAGFKNINVDLIFGLPDQTTEHWEKTLQDVLDWNPDHISAYGLQVEERTRFWKDRELGKLLIPDEDLQAEMYATLLALCKKKDYLQYEISNFAKKDFECKHNLIYWKNEEYLGLGLGAVSYIDGKRFWMTRILEKYLTGEERVIGSETLDKKGRIAETLMLGLRLREGMSVHDFETRFDQKLLATYSSEIEKFEKLKLLSIDNERLKLTDKGMLLSNEVLQAFL